MTYSISKIKMIYYFHHSFHIWITIYENKNNIIDEFFSSFNDDIMLKSTELSSLAGNPIDQTTDSCYYALVWWLKAGGVFLYYATFISLLFILPLYISYIAEGPFVKYPEYAARIGIFLISFVGECFVVLLVIICLRILMKKCREKCGIRGEDTFDFWSRHKILIGTS